MNLGRNEIILSDLCFEWDRRLVKLKSQLLKKQHRHLKKKQVKRSSLKRRHGKIKKVVKHYENDIHRNPS